MTYAIFLNLPNKKPPIAVGGGVHYLLRDEKMNEVIISHHTAGVQDMGVYHG